MQLFIADEPVMKYHVLSQPKLIYLLLKGEPVGFTVVLEHCRMGHAQNNIQNRWLCLDYRRHRIEHNLDPLVFAQQTEGKYCPSALH